MNNDWIFIGLGLFLLLDVFIVIAVLYFRGRRKFSEKDIRYFSDRFRRLESIVEQDARFVVLEADKLFDRALSIRGYEGSLAEKLRKAEMLFHDVQALWRAHKLRNFIAHEVDSSVSVGDAKSALRAFKRAFRDIGISL